jgi:hypothetical protein
MSFSLVNIVRQNPFVLIGLLQFTITKGETGSEGGQYKRKRGEGERYDENASYSEVIDS